MFEKEGSNYWSWIKREGVIWKGAAHEKTAQSDQSLRYPHEESLGP